MSLRRAMAWVAAAVVGTSAVVLLAGKQVDPTVHLRARSLDLTRPERVLTTMDGVGPSDLGYFSWTGTRQLGFFFGDLHADDLVKLKLLSSCGQLPLRVSLDGTAIGVLSVGGHWRESVVRLPRAGSVLEIVREADRPCTVHFSRVKSTNMVGYSSSFPQLYILYDPGPYRAPGLPSAGRARDLAPAVLAGLGVLLVGWLLGGPSQGTALSGACVGLTVGVVLLVGFEIVDLAGSLRVAYPPRTLWALLFVPGVVGVAWGARRLLRRLTRSAMAPLRDLPARIPAIPRAWRFLSATAVSERALRWLGVGALVAYGTLLLAFLPRTPFEWDEILFLRALDRFDVAAHSPHPPGYPVFVAASRVFPSLGVSAVRAPQMAAISGALIAVAFLTLLLRRLDAPALSSGLGALLLAALPPFAFHANVGLSDVLATGVAVAAVWSLVRFLERPWRHRDAALAAALTALAVGVRPQVALALGAVAAWSLARSVVRRSRAAITFVGAGLFVGCACWAPVVLVTGWHRYWGSVTGMRRWIAAHEAPGHLPGLSVADAVQAWLVQPFATEGAAVVLWVLVVLGGYCWWRAGRRRLVVVLAASAAGYLLTAPWIMAADTSVRYILPALPFLAGLAAGVTVARAGASRTLATTAVVVVIVGLTWWTVPVLAQRAGEEAPVWAGLQWIRARCGARRTAVIFDGVLTPHAEYVLRSNGFAIRTLQDAQANPPRSVDVQILSPSQPTTCEVLFAAAWPSKRMRRLTRRRYLSCEVVRCNEPGRAH